MKTKLHDPFMVTGFKSDVNFFQIIWDKVTRTILISYMNTMGIQ